MFETSYCRPKVHVQNASKTRADEGKSSCSVANECSIALPNTHSHILGNFNRELPDDILRPGFPTVELLERIYDPSQLPK